jgi:ligand-binding sensor domain-containing protein
MPIRLIIALLSLTLFVLKAEREQSDWFYRAWQTEDGLPDNSVSGVTQSPDGYLWVSTNGGTIRFNGNSFSAFPLRKIPALPSQQVRTMFMDRLGHLWLAMERGPVLRVGEYSYRSFDKDDGITGEKTQSITDDANAQLWVAYSRNVLLIRGDEVTRLTAEEKIPVGPQSSLTCDNAGQVWLSNGG